MMSATVHSLPGYRVTRQEALAISKRQLADAERERYARPVNDLDVAWTILDEAEAIVPELPKQMILHLMRTCRLRLKEL